MEKGGKTDGILQYGEDKRPYTLLRSITGELLYLVEGQEKAALIDTCLGVGHLRSLVES
mgnify:FL=1